MQKTKKLGKWNRVKLLFFGTIILLLGIQCQESNNTDTILVPTVKTIKTPCENGGEPNLFVSDEGATYLSWVEYLNDTTDVLFFSKLVDTKWSSPIEIAQGSNWFVNWADFPSFAMYKNGKGMVAHWLQKSAAGTYDYDVHIAQSKDNGQTWGDSFIIHTDNIAAEHGFVTMLPLSEKRMFATWLDGRNTKSEEGEKDEHGHGGAMTLRTAEFDLENNRYEEAELDNKICDCCQTDAVMTSEGMVVVYRDRMEHEIRDISIVRKTKEGWTRPHLIHADNWEISSCPVNGPAIDAIENTVVVAWFTAANNTPQVKVTFSNNSGQTFQQPILVSKNIPIGRVDVILLNAQEAFVTWMEETEKGMTILSKKVRPNRESEKAIEIAQTSPSRQSGFPRVKKNKNQIIYAWTQADSLTYVKTAILENIE